MTKEQLKYLLKRIEDCIIECPQGDTSCARKYQKLKDLILEALCL